MGNYFIGYAVENALWHDPRRPLPGEGLWWVHPHDLHMTVAFLGAISERKARECFAWAILQGVPPVRGSLGAPIPLGSRPPASAFARPFLNGEKEAKAVLKTLAPPLLEQAGRPPETREPLPHITVLRAQRSASVATQQQILPWLTEQNWEEDAVSLTCFGLFGWTPERSVRRYQLIEHIRLDDTLRD